MVDGTRPGLNSTRKSTHSADNKRLCVAWRERREKEAKSRNINILAAQPDSEKIQKRVTHPESLQMGRGGTFGSETTEFVTKRMCLTFVLSISFLCLLAGFIIGRFVSDQILVMRDTQMLQDLDANGLAKTLYLRDSLLESLNHSSYHESADMIPDMQLLKQLEVNRTEDLFKDLSLFKLNVKEISNCTVATICGTQEQDRYIILSANGEGYDVAYKVAKSFDELYRKKAWEPKRTVIFCVFLSETDSCMENILHRIKPKIVAYIAIHGKAARGHKEITISGSGMVQATMFDAVDEVKLFNGYDLSVADSRKDLPRLNVDIPHVKLSFIDENRTDQYASENQKTLAQIAGITIFRLSEQVFFKWNPKHFGDNINKSLDLIVQTQVQEAKDNLTESVRKLITDIEEFNLILGRINMLKLLDVRMMNDKLIDLDRALLCPDPYTRSKTDFTVMKDLSSDPDYIIKMRFNDMKNCYEAARRIILDQAQCRQIIKDDHDS